MMRRTPQAGFGMLEAIMALSFVVVIGGFIAARISRTMTGVKHFSTRTDLEVIRRTLLLGVDCDATFLNAGITDPLATIQCPSGGSGNFMLYRRTSTGPLPFASSLDADGSFKLGSWNLKASCAASDGTLTVRAARKSANTFLKDPLTGEILNWTWNPKVSVLFGTQALTGRSDKKLCYGNGVATNQFAVAFRTFDWNAATQHMTKPITQQAGPTEAIITVDNVGANAQDGVGCNSAKSLAEAAVPSDAISSATSPLA